MNLQDRLFEAVRKHDLLPDSTRLIVAVSGGADSLALLHALAARRKSLNVFLHVATLDHGLRGAAGADDAQFVAETARAWGLEATVGYVDVRALATESRTSTEAAARRARYDFLASVAREQRADRVAVAHHADDQVETILLHILRGSGLGGLAGMASSAPLPGHPDLTLIRPLLGVPRADLVAYCAEHDLQPRHDASNDDLKIIRNRLRSETIPYLRQLSPQVERRLFQLSEIASLESDYVDFTLHQAIDPHVSLAERRISLPRRVFASLHPALQRRFVVWAVRQLGAAQDVSYVLVTAAVELAQRGQVGARAQLKGGVQLRNDYFAIHVEYESEPIPDDFPLLPEGVEIPLTIPGAVPFGDSWKLHATLTPQGGQAASIAVPEGSAVVLRGRRKGDRFPSLNRYSASLPDRVGHTHKLNEWMIDHRVPRYLRERLPLIVVDDQVAAVWWQGWTVNRNFAPKVDSPRTVFILLSRIYESNNLKT